MLHTLKQWLKAMGRRHGLDLSPAPDWAQVFSKITTILDVGANEGQTYDYMRGMGWTGPIISFEAWPETYATLLRKKGYNWDRNLCTLGSENRDVAFYAYPPCHRGSNSAFILKDPAIDPVQGTTVHAVRLDGQALSLPDGPFLLKIDAEGMDTDVFLGATTMLHRIPYVMMEVATEERFYGEPLFHAVIDFMHDHGYHVIFIDRQIKGAMDVVFAHNT